jgi:hypothetical protein
MDMFPDAAILAGHRIMNRKLLQGMLKIERKSSLCEIDFGKAVFLAQLCGCRSLGWLNNYRQFYARLQSGTTSQYLRIRSAGGSMKTDH